MNFKGLLRSGKAIFERLRPLVYSVGVAGITNICAGAIPDNDNFASRTSLFGTNINATGNNIGATIELNEPDPSFMAAKSVWWTWTAPVNGYVTLTTVGSTFDTMLGVYSGNDLTNLTMIAFNDTETNTSALHFNALAGTAYQISVDGADGPAGNISLHLTIAPPKSPPPNDNFSNRITISGTHLSNINGSNVAATREDGEPYHADQVGGKSIWWQWTAPATGWLTLTTSGSSIDTVLALYTGNSVSNLTFVAGNDEDPTSKFGLISRITANVTSNTTYQIAVDGYDDDSGDIRLQLDLTSPLAPPPNDNFTNRILLTGSSFTATGTNSTASFEAVGADFLDGEPEHLVTFGGKSIWWRWIAPSSGNVTLSTSNSTFDTVLCVYTGNALTNLAFVAGNDEDIYSPTGLISRLSFNATSGTEYQFVVDGYDGDSGIVKLKLTMGSLVSVPANDDFNNRILLAGNNPSATVSTLGATFETGEPLHNNVYGGKSVWWKWVSPASGIVTVDTIGSDFDTVLAVYRGDSLTNLAPVASDDESGGSYTSLLTFYTKSGATNQIAVDGYDGDSGTVNLHIAFTSASYSLNVATNPANYGTIVSAPPPDQNGNYAPDSVVTLLATAVQPGTDFTNWTSSARSTNNPLSITMNSNRVVTGNFYYPPPRLGLYLPQTGQSIKTNGFRLTLSGPPTLPYSYAIDITTDFLNWQGLITNQFTVTPSVQIQDFSASNSPSRFYRARRIQ